MFGRKKRQLTKVLIVEDEPLVAFDTERFLTGEGFEIVATVDTSAEALALLDQGAPIELMLLDLGLTDGSGVGVAQRAHAKGIPVLFVTGNCPGAARSIAAGCLAKPYQQRDLALAIDAIEAAITGDKPKRLPGGFTLFLERAA